MSKAILELNGQLHHLDLHDNETLLEAAMRYNLDAPYACMSGACTQCKALLTEGEVDMDDSGALSAEEIDEGYILTCQARPRDGQGLEYKYEDE